MNGALDFAPGRLSSLESGSNGDSPSGRRPFEQLLQARQLNPRFGNHAGQKRVFVFEDVDPAETAIGILPFAKVINCRTSPRPLGFNTD
jgi:hypothetical protein